MREVPRRVRWPVIGATTIVVSLVLFFPPVLAAALDGASSSLAGSAPLDTVAGAGTLVGMGTGKTTITYCHDGGLAQTLDVDEPSPLPAHLVPTVVYIHGGGWTGGDSSVASGSLIGQVASAVAAKGWIFVSVDYRLAPRFQWPAQIDDASCAVRFLRANAAALHVDPRHIGAIGDSAGGQVAALLGLAGRGAGFDVGQNSRRSSAVQAVVDLYGPADLTSSEWKSSGIVEAVAPRVFGTTLGPAPPGTPAARVLAAASPVTYVGPGAPPFLILQGDADTVVPPGQSVELAERLRAAGDSATLVLVRGATHEFVPVPGDAVTPGVGHLAADATGFLIRTLGSP
jgi:acetyl esterase/lipase